MIGPALAPAATLPPRYDLDAAVAGAERERIFGRTPQLVVLVRESLGET